MAIAPPLPPALQAPLAPLVVGLLESRTPARVAWTSPSGAPRVVALWHHWTGTHLEFAAFAGARKLDELRDGATVAVIIDTDEFPYRSLALGGPVEVRPGRGLAPCYRAAAVRYLGSTTAARWLDFLDGRDQAVIAITPRWARLSDMSRSPFFPTDELSA